MTATTGGILILSALLGLIGSFPLVWTTHQGITSYGKASLLRAALSAVISFAWMLATLLVLHQVVTASFKLAALAVLCGYLVGITALAVWVFNRLFLRKR